MYEGYHCTVGLGKVARIETKRILWTFFVREEHLARLRDKRQWMTVLLVSCCCCCWWWADWLVIAMDDTTSTSLIKTRLSYSRRRVSRAGTKPYFNGGQLGATTALRRRQRESETESTWSAEL